MAVVYAPPAELGDPPDFMAFMDEETHRFDYEAARAAEEAWIATVQAEARRRNKGDIVGEVVRYPQGDGYAMYVVWSTKPAALVHLPVGDAWHIPEAHARGLRTSDLREQVARDKRMSALFKRS